MIALPPHDNILVVGPSWVGDMVMAQSLLMSLKRQNPGHRITVMAPQRVRPLLGYMPEVEGSIAIPLEHGELGLGKRRQLGKALRIRQFTHAIVLPNSFKSALIPFHAGIARRTGWLGEWRQLLLTDCRKLDRAAFPRMVDRYASLAYPPAPGPPDGIPAPALKVNAAQRQQALSRFQLATQHPVIAVCAGAEFGEAKQWPARHFAAMVNHLAGKGWQFWLFGSVQDQLITESILADVEPGHLPACTNLAGATSLAQAIDLLSCVTAVVSNDSGLMHVAAALNKPVVGLYGSTSSTFTPPLTERVKLLGIDLECRPCFRRQCPYGHHRCLTELKPRLAIEALEQLVSGCA